MEFQENGLINGYTYEALSSCIYVGVSGTAEELNDGFICQVKICPRRQMMGYAREVNWPRTQGLGMCKRSF